jgi:glycosyltransferase involved in cell wall biosynthesis
MTIIMADGGIAFDGRTAETAPLGGAESAFVGLAEGLAARGHRVVAYTMTAGALAHRGVEWRPLAHGLPDAADLYIANRGDRLLPLVPRAQCRAFWIHNPARYLRKWRFVSKLARWRPTIIFSGAYHASTYPRWAPGRRAIIPFGIEEVFRNTAERSPPPPRAAFTANPLRGLDRLLDIWVEQIRAAVPAAELHVFSGSETYGSVGAAKSKVMAPILDRAASLNAAGVVMRGPLPKARLAEELRCTRLYLHGGSPEETFCLSAAEAQACGVPGVVQAIGALPERIVDGETGFVAHDREAFAASAVALLRDDALWQRQHRAAIARQQAYGWIEAAADWEATFGLPGRPVDHDLRKTDASGGSACDST